MDPKSRPTQPPVNPETPSLPKVTMSKMSIDAARISFYSGGKIKLTKAMRLVGFPDVHLKNACAPYQRVRRLKQALEKDKADEALPRTARAAYIVHSSDGRVTIPHAMRLLDFDESDTRGGSSRYMKVYRLVEGLSIQDSEPSQPSEPSPPSEQCQPKTVSLDDLLSHSPKNEHAHGMGIRQITQLSADSPHRGKQ